MVKINAGPRLRVTAFWPPLTVGAISRNLGPTFFRFCTHELNYEYYEVQLNFIHEIGS